MDWQNMFEALEFQNQRILNDKINSISTVETDALVSHRQRHLPLKFQSAKIQFMAEALRVGRLHQARTKFAVYFNGSADDLLSEVFMKKFAPCLRVSVVNHVCSTPTLNSGTSGFRAAASRACVMASRVSMGSMILSIHNRAAPYLGSVCSS